MEMPFSNSVGTIDAIAHLDGVEIDLHDALLRPKQLDKESKISLKALAQPRTAGPKKNVLGSLLADGASSELTFLRMLAVAARSMLNGLEVKAMMLQKTLILTRHHRYGQ